VASLRVDGDDLVVTRLVTSHTSMWGSFPMAPWAGRLGGARFTHEGRTHQLAADLPPHAIHGTVATRSWRVDAATDATVTMTCDLGPGWPLGGAARQDIELGPGALRCTLRVTAADRSMPVTIGWHVWLRATGPVRLTATAMYERGTDGLPTGRLVPPRPGPWDDCFLTTRPVGVLVGAHDVTVASDCDHVVVFDELADGVAVEPQSGPPDSFHLGAPVLDPGGSIERTMTIRWHRAPAPVAATRG